MSDAKSMCFVSSSLYEFESRTFFIKGIGPKTANKLLEHFGSVENIKNAPDEEIETIIGKAKLNILKEALK